MDDISGIGPKRRKALMKAFPSLEDIKGAEQDELRQVDGMNEASARAVYEFFHKNQ